MGRKTYGDRGDHADRNKILKKQIEKLKIENARLRKELNKLVGHMRENDNRDPEEQTERDERQNILRCPDCNSPSATVIEFSIKGEDRKYLVCKDCGYKKRM